MDIMKLDEFEGLTADMVRAWLRANGFTLTGDQYSEGSVWVSGNGKRIYDSRILTADGLKWLALVSEVSPQSLLREINPRMRAGLPTQAELDAHRGFWIGHMGGKYPMPSVGYFQPLIGGMEWRSGNAVWDMDALERAAQSEYPCAFWPCDQHGNKTRRGV